MCVWYACMYVCSCVCGCMWVRDWSWHCVFLHCCLLYRHRSLAKPRAHQLQLALEIPRFCSPVLGLLAADTLSHIGLGTRDPNFSRHGTCFLRCAIPVPEASVECRRIFSADPRPYTPSPSISTKIALLGCISSQKNILEIALLSWFGTVTQYTCRCWLHGPRFSVHGYQALKADKSCSV